MRCDRDEAAPGHELERDGGVLARAVARSHARKARRVPARIGIDEKAVGKGHESLVVDLDRGTAEAVVDDRTHASLERHYRQFTPEELQAIEAIAMNRRDPYLAATKACVPDAAAKIVFDRYHATTRVRKAVDTVRRREHKALAQRGDLRLQGRGTCGCGTRRRCRCGGANSSTG
jgi:transposase